MPRMGELERSVMEVLWASPGPHTVREVHAELDSERDLAYTTVMTVLVRLAEKGLATRERDGRAWRYRAARTREDIIAETMHSALGDDRGARSAALLAFVERVSDDEAAMLREALAELESQRPGSS